MKIHHQMVPSFSHDTLKKDVLVERLEHVIAVALGAGASGLGGVPVERNGLKGELGVSAPAVILAALLGITGIDSLFKEKTVLPIADVAGGLGRNPGMGPNAQILPSAVFWWAGSGAARARPSRRRGRPPGTGPHRP